MKKLFLIITTLVLSSIVHAQQGEIIYREFDPPLGLVQDVYGPAQILELDFDGDGVTDHRFYGEDDRWHEFDVMEVSLNGWETRLVNLDENDPYTFDENDTLIPNAPNGWRRGPNFAYYYFPNLNANGIYHETWGMHIVIDDKNYYGWYHGYGMEGRDYSGGPYLYKIYIDKIAFCTIPDYPLCYGQTGLTDGIEENKATSFVTLYPNPATGLVTLKGQDLKSAEVFNTLGQCVATIKGEGEQLKVNISSLPAGVYFVNITDGEGRKCVKKVVKE